MSTFNGFNIVERWFLRCGKKGTAFATKNAAEKRAKTSDACFENSGPLNGYGVGTGWFVYCKGKIRIGPLETEDLAKEAAKKLPECGAEDPTCELPPPNVNGGKPINPLKPIKFKFGN
ncbi:SPOR domain-containing protein [Pseudomonas sp. Irchel 3H7]|uniref:SPOR domain-containing protein n=1 Tax=Pseudomonas sp. Irchel 3H7 TaxID=2009042 RepID=UPI00114021FA|nr:SPOR domain-containing protein [Pseudomonas sp. Irchel 3H7]